MRIIAGSAKGRRFEAPKGLDTRPTLDRVKESLFGILQFRVMDADVLDLFSGSGNLGLEAASRGARQVVCNDSSRACAALIRSNAALLGLADRIRVLCLDYGAALRQLHGEGQRFDIALLDAPYADGMSERAAAALLDLGLMRPGGQIVIEHDRRRAPVAPPLVRLCGQRGYGAVGLTIWECTA